MDSGATSEYARHAGISNPSIYSGPPPHNKGEVTTSLAPFPSPHYDQPLDPLTLTSLPPPINPVPPQHPVLHKGAKPPGDNDGDSRNPADIGGAGGGDPIGDGGGNPDPEGGDGTSGGGGGPPGGPPGGPNGNPSDLPNPNDPPQGLSPPNTDNKDDLALWMLDFIRTSQDQHSALLHTLTTKESRPERPRIRTPDAYDGSDPKKLDPYISQCAAYIGSCWDSFRSEMDKVVWMHSYLKGAAHQHFAEQLSNAQMAGLPPPAWYRSTQLFLDELTAVFGSLDPVADAIASLEALCMHHGNKVHQYNLDFNCHAAKTLWDQNALRHRYYSGLPDRIKDELSRCGKIFSLQSLQTVAWQIDSRYWEREAEKKREHPPKPADSMPNSAPQPVLSSASNSASSSGSSEARKAKGKLESNFRSSTSSHSGSVSSPLSFPSVSSSGPAQKPWAKDLGPNGKLLPAIREERMKKGLCLVCGQFGHWADACPKASSSSKARAASISASPASPASSSASGSAPAGDLSSQGGSTPGKA